MNISATTRHLWVALLLMTLPALAPAAVAQGVTFFSDQSAFEDAAGNLTTEDFAEANVDENTPFCETDSPLDSSSGDSGGCFDPGDIADGLTITAVGPNADNDNVITVLRDNYFGFIPNDTPAVSGTSRNDTLAVSATGDPTAIGLSLFTTRYPNGVIAVEVYDADGTLIGDTTVTEMAGDELAFLGITSDTPIGSVEVSTPLNASVAINEVLFGGSGGGGPVDQAIHDTGTVQFEVFANGFLGTTPPGFAETGFVFEGDLGLFHAAFVVGASESQVSGNLYGGADATSEWETESGLETLAMPFDAPLDEFDQGFRAVFDDGAAPNPIGLEVTQRSYSSSENPNDTFVILEYVIENTSGSDLTGIYPGVFADWDVGGAAFETNLAGFDEASKLLYVYDPTGATDNFFGVVALGNETPVSGVAFDGEGGPDTDDQIYGYLTTTSPDPTAGGDRRTTLGVGPYDISAGDSVVVRYAFVGGEDLFDIIQNAVFAQNYYADSVEEAVHNTNTVEFEVFDFGKLGTFFGSTDATGFVFNGQNGLFEGSFLVGASPTQVSGDVYDFGTSNDWDTLVPIYRAGVPEDFDQAFRASYTDSTAADPIGLITTQFSFSDANDDYVPVEFTVTNISGEDLADLYVGVFADWDISPDALQDLGGYDDLSRLLYVYDGSNSSSNYFGVAALGSDDDVSVSGVFFDALPGDATLYEALTTIAPDATAPEDRRTVIGLGPYSIEANGSVTATFAFVGGQSLADIIANACDAQGPEGCMVDAVEETTPAGTFMLHSAYPNPFASATTLGFTLPEAQEVQLTVYDVLGRRVATLADGLHPAGYSSVRLDAADLPSGTYFYRLVTDTTDLTQRVSLVR